MQVNSINFEIVNTNYNTKANTAEKQQESSRPQVSEAYSANASMAIKNTMLAAINVNKTEAAENKEVRIAGGSVRAKGEMTNLSRSYERGEFINHDTMISSGEEAFPDTKVNAGELVMYGDSGRRMATGMDGITNRFQAAAQKDENCTTIDDSVVKAGVRFNEVKEKHGDYAIMDENGLVSFYDKDGNNIGTMQAVVNK